MTSSRPTAPAATVAADSRPDAEKRFLDGMRRMEEVDPGSVMRMAVGMLAKAVGIEENRQAAVDILAIVPPERIPATLDMEPTVASILRNRGPTAWDDARLDVLESVWHRGDIPASLPDPGPHRPWLEAFAATHAAEPWSLRLLAALATDPP